jgi:MinD-like ATPase involved in chromosome partitioning or flagellar assembly
MIVRTLQIVAAVGTIVTGLVSLIWPRSVTGFTGLSAQGGRGITEIRAILGGVFIGLGAASLILDAKAAYQTLGIMYLVVAAVRTVSMFIDRSVVSSNIISIVVEILFGIILVL